MAWLKGKKTYITAIVGALVMVLGAVLGPFDIGSVTIPQVDPGAAAKALWEAAMLVFLRKGVSALK